MVFLNLGVVGLLLGKLLGGSFRNLAETRIRTTGLAFGAVGLQLIAFPSDALPWSTPTSVAKALWLASYALLIAMIVRNRRLPGAAIVGAGLACNLAAILANGGLMPVRRAALAASGGHYHIHNNSIQLGHPHLALLVDRWAVPAWVPLANVFSIGDVVIGLGLVVGLVVAMRTPSPAAATADARPALS
jgi:Family of unknown function (DUF5317)